MWTQDVGRAVRLARRVHARQVAVNTLGDGGAAGAIGAPFGGYRHSSSAAPWARTTWRTVRR
ncbi:hypothetical protein AB0D91_43300 [Streptomyces canus]|uniref:hypothetical protein n=1 Tax=Streptomyces canus TaxID=58343 RepID=UPI0033CC0D60